MNGFFNRYKFERYIIFKTKANKKIGLLFFMAKLSFSLFIHIILYMNIEYCISKQLQFCQIPVLNSRVPFFNSNLNLIIYKVYYNQSIKKKT